MKAKKDIKGKSKSVEELIDSWEEYFCTQYFTGVRFYVT